MSSATGAEAAKTGRSLGLGTATGLVVASMIGTGVFTTTGLLVPLVRSPLGILLCWLVGGVAALCGALSYAELGAALPSNGGEYHFLSRLYHPSLGFLSAFASFVVGFSAPLAAGALAFGEYFAAFVPSAPPKLVGALLVAGLSALHLWRVSAGTGFQNVFTAGKVALIVAFIVALSLRGDPARLGLGSGSALAAVVSPGFAIGLLLVSFAYTGWNAASYVAGEIDRPSRVLPLALAIGTALVTLLYLGLNAVFLAAAPLPLLSGEVKVGHVAALQLLGPAGAKILSAVVMLGLVSMVGAVIITGPRVYEALGADFARLRFLSRRRPGGGPTVAIVLQAIVALCMMLTASFEALLIYIGFTLSLFAALAVCGVFLLRRRRDIERPFSTPGYPATPLVFVALMAWMVIHAVVQRPLVAAAGGATVLCGAVAYLAGRSGRPT
ncbi:MAG: amino acid permease [Deltaproteobacteria bacterium]|nr:amino acid permease [Deltaproteobacteria bacterium]